MCDLPIYRSAVSDLHKSDERSPEPAKHSLQVENFPKKRIERFNYRIFSWTKKTIGDSSSWFIIVKET